MNKQLNNMLGELYEFKNLLSTLNQAHLYCYDSDINTYHLHTIIEYTICKLDNFIKDFQKIETDYFQKHKL